MIESLICGVGPLSLFYFRNILEDSENWRYVVSLGVLITLRLGILILMLGGMYNKSVWVNDHNY